MQPCPWNFICDRRAGSRYYRNCQWSKTFETSFRFDVNNFRNNCNCITAAGQCSRGAIFSGRGSCVSRQTKRCIKFGSFVLLILYIAVLIYVCFFSEDYGRDVVTSYYRYNFIPLKEIRRFYIYRDVVGIRAFLANLFGNVLAFMPFGFFMPILRSRLRKWYCMLGMTFLLSLMIEITQLLTRVGSFDVDDLILNTSGGILGYLLFYIINKVRRKWNGA